MQSSLLPAAAWHETRLSRSGEEASPPLPRHVPQAAAASSTELHAHAASDKLPGRFLFPSAGVAERAQDAPRSARFPVTDRRDPRADFTGRARAQ